jgi:hypothetical protein
MTKLTIELVPKTAWYTNVRAVLSKKEWNDLARVCYNLAGNVCEICGDVGTNQGQNHKVECHEIWDYNDETHVQKLTGFISLCPRCHKVKHAGLAISQKQAPLVIDQLIKVNQYSVDDAMTDILNAFELHKQRSMHKWTTIMDYVNEFKHEHRIGI